MHKGQEQKILIAEDEPVLLRSLIFTLKRFRYQVHGVSKGSEVLQTISNPAHEYNLLITDIQLPEITGLELIDKIKESGIEIPILVITAYNDQAVLSEITRRNVGEYLTKPFSMEELMLRVERLLKAEKRTV